MLQKVSQLIELGQSQNRVSLNSNNLIQEKSFVKSSLKTGMKSERESMRSSALIQTNMNSNLDPTILISNLKKSTVSKRQSNINS